MAVSQSGVTVVTERTDPPIQVSQSGVSVVTKRTAPEIIVSQSGVTVVTEWSSPEIIVSQSGVTVITCVAPLAPILTGMGVGLDGVLNWSPITAFVHNYRIEVSNDGINFLPLATVSNTTFTYTHIEPNHLLPWYYRVAQFHACNNSPTYSNVVRLNFMRCEIRTLPLVLGEYKIQLYSSAGVLLADFDAYYSLDFRHVLNDVSTATLVLSGNDPRTELFELGCLLEIWRRVPGYAPAAVPPDRLRSGEWYCEWEGLYDDYEALTKTDGEELFTVYAVSYIDLLRRREILYPSTDTESPSNKVAARPTQTAMYEFVRENVGEVATVANGRLITGTITPLQIPAMVGGGPNWRGARAWRNLLRVLQELAEYGGVDFDIIGKGGGQWNFETFVNQLGADRTTTGLDSTTGRNAAGNPPVIFANQYDNFAQGVLKSRNRSSANVIAALGQGEGVARDYVVAIVSAEIDAGRVNQREVTRNASAQSNLPALWAYAEGVRQELRSGEDLNFDPLITANGVYGVHFWWTDRVTAIYRGVSRNKRITQVTVRVDQQGERFTQWKFETV